MEQKRLISTNKYINYILIILSLAYLAVPIFEIKLLLLGLIITLILRFIPEKFLISKNTQLLLLLFVYSLTYLVVPYWTAVEKTSLFTLIRDLIVNLSVLGIGLLSLSYVYKNNSQDIYLVKNKDTYKIFLALFSIYAILNYLPMNNSLTSMGDSEGHIMIGFSLINYLTLGYSLILLSGAILFIVLFSIYKKKYFLFLMVLCFTGVGVISIFHYHTSPWGMRRYPILHVYLNMFFSYPLSAFIKKSLAFDDGFYRILPFISVIGIACVALSKMRTEKFILKILMGIAIITIPNLVYHSSLTYIELPLLFLIVAAIFSYENQIWDFIENNKISTTIISLMLAFFMKETVIVYGIAFFLVTTFLVLFQSEKTTSKKFVKLFEYFVLVFIPILVFLFFRHMNVPFRTYAPHISNLFISQNYNILVISLWDQLGLLFPLSAISFIYLLFRKKYVTSMLSILIVVGYITFYMMDSGVQKVGEKIIVNKALGQARFNLYVLPGILVLLITALNEVKHNILKYTYVLMPLIIIVNISLSPIDFLTGIRKAGWADYTFKTSEYDFPYNEFYKWLSKQKDVKKICFVGRNHPYQDSFYTEKYNLNFEKFKAPRGNVPDSFFFESFDLVVYHENPDFPVSIEYLNELKLLKVFQRGNLRLSVYKQFTP